MHIRSIKTIAVAAMMFFSLAHNAQAITFNFSGTFSEANGLWEPFLQSFIGQTFSGSFSSPLTKSVMADSI